MTYPRRSHFTGIDDVITSCTQKQLTQLLVQTEIRSREVPVHLLPIISTDQNTSQEIATNTSNIHLTANRVRVPLDSSLQGHLKVLTKLTRGIERANHHSQLVQIAIDTKRPPRGLIPTVSPKISDTPGSFTVEWENPLQEAGLVLTKKLQDYWTNRVTRFEAEHSPIYNKLKSISTQEQWNTIKDILEQTSRETQQELKRKKSRQPNPQPTTSSNNPPKEKS